MSIRVHLRRSCACDRLRLICLTRSPSDVSTATVKRKFGLITPHGPPREAGDIGGPVNWPGDVKYTSNLQCLRRLPSEKFVQNQITTIKHIRSVELFTCGAGHPCAGGIGVRAKRLIVAGTSIGIYAGVVEPASKYKNCEPEERKYVMDFGADVAWCIDAKEFGNELRFVNDPKNTGLCANVEFIPTEAGDTGQNTVRRRCGDARHPARHGAAR